MGRWRKERKTRDQRKTQFFRLKHYLIVTDAEKTERNYFEGLKKTLPIEIRDKISIEIITARPLEHLIRKAEDIISKKVQPCEVWLVFDRDETNNFDGIIESAQRKSFNVGWSNPCIETWFCAYFGRIPKKNISRQCIEEFAKEYMRVVKQKYHKNGVDIYNKLVDYGDEKNAIKISRNRMKEYEEISCKPSERYGATTVFVLVEEIKNTKV